MRSALRGGRDDMTGNFNMRAIRSVIRVATMASVACLVAMTALAQETTGTVRGRITDPQGLAVPGVTVTTTGPQGVSTSGSAGSANPSISGGSGLENQYVIDGVNVTNSGYGALGAYSIVFGSLGNATPFDFVKEVQVKTGGYEAEFGQATGGVVNVVTKSGSNDVRGSLFGYTPPAK